MRSGSRTVSLGLGFFNLFVVLVLAAVAFGSARAAEPAETVLLVATPELGADYSHTVLIAKGIAEGRHVGLIVNRPTALSLATVFPASESWRAVADPLHLGGPVAADAVFALVRTKESPGEPSLQLAPDLFLVADRGVIDGILEQQPDRARFYAGLVVWEPGELAAEIESGFWFVRSADSNVVFKKQTEGLWEELTRTSRGVTPTLRTAALSVTRRTPIN